MMNLDATFEMVSARQRDLRLLAGPQPMIPLGRPPFDSLRQRISQLMARLGDGPIRASRPASASPQGSRP
jgi:hypothetical protein